MPWPTALERLRCNATPTQAQRPVNGACIRSTAYKRSSTKLGDPLTRLHTESTPHASIAVRSLSFRFLVLCRPMQSILDAHYDLDHKYTTDSISRCPFEMSGQSWQRLVDMTGRTS